MGANLCDRHRDVEGSLLLTKQAAKVGWKYFSCLISIAIALPMAGFQAVLQMSPLKYC